MIKIGIICYPTYGGSGVFATELGKALSERNYEIHFITYEQPTRLEYLSKNVFFHPVDIRTYPLFKYPPYELALSSKIIQVMESVHLDLLHVHYAIPHANAAYMANQVMKESQVNIPFITTLHGTDITLVGKFPIYKPLVEFTINNSTMVTAVSNSLKQNIHDFFNIRKEIHVIPNFIDLNIFKKRNNDYFKKSMCPNGEKLLIHISNFRPVKRTEDVVHIFSKVREKMPVKLVMVGDGPERETCEELCRTLQVCEDIRFLGNLESVQDLLSICDVFIMPSEQESFGLAALEAMACSVPIITTHVGGLPELNVNGYCGFMSEVGDIEKMARDTIHILSEGQLELFKKNALSRAKMFDKNILLPKYIDLYQKLFEENKS